MKDQWSDFVPLEVVHFRDEDGVVAPDVRVGELTKDLHAWLRATHASLSVKSPFAGAIQYTLARWAALTRYVEDGRIEIGRVGDWRGAHTSRGVAVAGRAGASVRWMCPVSSRRSSVGSRTGAPV